MLWIKAFHIVFVVSWYVGLLYLPRLFVYHAATEDEVGYERFLVMERKLLGIMSVGAIGSLLLGLWLATYWWGAIASALWLQVKFALVVALVVYHVMCAKIIRQFERRENSRSHVFFRFFNEVPALILIAISILVVVKPF